MFDFGLRLRSLREQYNLSQEQLGKKIERSKSVISNYENNIKIPPLDVLSQMAVIFNVSLDYLAGIDKKEMVSVENLSAEQKAIIFDLINEFKKKQVATPSLSISQQEILNKLLVEFNRK